MKNPLKYILLALLMGVLFLPLMQEYFTLSKVRPLSGDFVPAHDVKFTRDTWFNGEFQFQKEKFLHDNFGYHNTAIRLHNQLGYYLFRKAKANGVVIGKENYLYEYKYIESYYGTDFIGRDSIQKKLDMIAFLADTFKQMNKTFLVVFAPGKGFYYPEFIPDYKKQRGITNIEVYRELIKKSNIPYIDFHSWYVANKGKTKYPLMPRYGTHWTQYGSMLATDSILKAIEQLRNIRIPDMEWKDIHIERSKDTDADIENGMNLLFRFEPETLAYPIINYRAKILPGETKPSILMIGDSFYWQIFGSGVSQVFDRSDFWYYFKSAHSPRYEHTKKIDDVDIIDEIKQHDVIIVMSTDVHLPKFGWGFIETMYNYYHGKFDRERFDPEFKKRINNLMEDIRADESWMKSITDKANRKNIPVDSMLYKDAKWMIEQDEIRNQKSNN